MSWQVTGGCFPLWWLIVLIFWHMVAVHQSQQQMAIMPFPIKGMLKPLKGLAVDKQFSLRRLHAPVLEYRFWCIRQSNPKTDRGRLCKKIMMFIPESHITYLNEAQHALYLWRIKSHIKYKGKGGIKNLTMQIWTCSRIGQVKKYIGTRLNKYRLASHDEDHTPRSKRFIVFI